MRNVSIYSSSLLCRISVRVCIGGLLERSAVAERRRPVLAAAGSILHRMRFDRYFVARFHAVGFPSLCGDLADRAHFERPFERSASGRIGDVHVEPAMRIGKFEFLQSSGDRYRFFMIEHCEGMMGPRLNSEGSHCKNDESGEFQIHGSPLDDSLR
jgi:hypothetical protein